MRDILTIINARNTSKVKSANVEHLPKRTTLKSFRHIDRTLSAKMDNRLDFQRLIKDSARRDFEILLAWKLDRFARNKLDSAHYKRVLKTPSFSDLYADVERHYETIRKYAQKTGRNLYSFGWLLDIARCLYTLCTGKIIAKTAAADWALENDLCPVPDALKIAVKARRNPCIYIRLTSKHLTTLKRLQSLYSVLPMCWRRN